MKEGNRIPKNERLEMVRNLIQSHEVTDQVHLRQLLLENGVEITQPSLSRDLKKLKAIKRTGKNGKTFYELPPDSSYLRVSESRQEYRMDLMSGFKSMRFSGNMCIIKTYPGYAASLAYHIDRSEIPSIIGTIAGDDTIFLVKEVNATANEVTANLKNIIPDII